MVITKPEVIAEVVSGYRAPYGHGHPAIGSQAFPGLLPTRPDNPMLPDNWEAWKTVEKFDKPFLAIFSDKDTIAPDGWKPLVKRSSHILATRPVLSKEATAP
jgi:haloalkane dehalogenase